jgi:hypothetical protein
MQLGDTTTMMWGMVFGAVGMGYLTYGRRQREAVPVVIGIGLCVLPYFIANTAVLVAAGVALAALPFLLRRFAEGSPPRRRPRRRATAGARAASCFRVRTGAGSRSAAAGSSGRGR